MQQTFWRTDTNMGRQHTTFIAGMSERNTHGLVGGILHTSTSSTKNTDYRATDYRR